VDRLFCFRDGQLERFEGNYSSYLERQQAAAGRPAGGAARSGSAAARAETAAAAPDPEGLAPSSNNCATAKPTPPRRRSFKENRELESIERDLPLWEQRRNSLEMSLANPSGGDYGQLETLTHELADLVERIHGAEERWLELSERPN
jgi:ATP-binding cassette subfamily F protein uup